MIDFIAVPTIEMKEVNINRFIFILQFHGELVLGSNGTLLNLEI